MMALKRAWHSDWLWHRLFTLFDHDGIISWLVANTRALLIAELAAC
jgi:hypothetical protein